MGGDVVATGVMEIHQGNHRAFSMGGTEVGLHGCGRSPVRGGCCSVGWGQKLNLPIDLTNTIRRTRWGLAVAFHPLPSELDIFLDLRINTVASNETGIEAPPRVVRPVLKVSLGEYLREVR